ncbi:MAG: BMP family ABC transporter substrate-binding protein [Thermomicrobiales bacterium]
MSGYRIPGGLITRRNFAAGAGIGAAALATKLGGRSVSAQDAAFKAAFIYVGPIGDGGYTFAHDQGRLALEANTGITTAYSENVPEVQAEAERVIRGYAEEGYQMIVATSFGHAPGVLAAAPSYPDVQFIHISGYQTLDNVSTGFGKIEEPRYVSGMIAGAMAETGTIGYVAAFPIPEVIRGINAFTLGVQRTNPTATVQVVWTNTWFDPALERSAAEALLDGGADVIAQHQDTAGPQQAAEDAGKFGVGYNSDMSALAPNANLTNPIWNWGVYYTLAAQQIMGGTWVGGNQYWGSWQDGVVDLSPIASFVPAETVTAAEAEIALFKSGESGVAKIFTGPLMGQNGSEMVAANVAMTDEEILNMNWFVQGVQGDI